MTDAGDTVKLRRAFFNTERGSVRSKMYEMSLPLSIAFSKQSRSTLILLLSMPGMSKLFTLCVSSVRYTLYNIVQVYSVIFKCGMVITFQVAKMRCCRESTHDDTNLSKLSSRTLRVRECLHHGMHGPRSHATRPLMTPIQVAGIAHEVIHRCPIGQLVDVRTPQSVVCAVQRLY